VLAGGNAKAPATRTVPANVEKPNRHVFFISKPSSEIWPSAGTSAEGAPN
jgi:hypothetical protein